MRMASPPYNIYRIFLFFVIIITITIVIYGNTSKALISNQSIGIKPHLTKYKKHFQSNENETFSIFDDDEETNDIEEFLDDSELIIEDGAIDDANDDSENDDDVFENLEADDDDDDDNDDDIDEDNKSIDKANEDDNEEAEDAFKQEDDEETSITSFSDHKLDNEQQQARQVNENVEKDGKTSINYESIRYNDDDYCVFPSIYKTTKRKNKITMILHTSSNYFGDNLLKMSQKWDGQISLAVFTSSIIYSKNETESSVENTIKKIFNLINCFEYLKDSLNVHIVVSWNRNVTCPSISMDAIPVNQCQTKVMTLEKFRFRTFSLMYPVNTMRNVARKFQDSEFILFADMEQEYSQNAEAILRYLANKWNIKDEKLGIAVRRFEYDESVAAPVTMDELRKAIEKKLVYQFHVFFWPQGHKIAKLKEWLNETHTFDDVISNDDVDDEDDDTETSKRWILSNMHTVDIRKLGTTYWEPMIVIHKSAPWHNEELPYGLDNHVALALHLCSAGYLFPVAPNVFSMHPGIRTTKEHRKLAYKGVFHGNKALRRFYERMAQEYPVNAKKCLKNRLPKHLQQKNHK